jgi:integrase
MVQKQADVKMSSEEILKLLIENDIVSEDIIQTLSKMVKKEKEKKEILDKHPYKISHNKDGKWRTKVKDLTKPDGRREIHRNSEEELEEALYQHYKDKETNPTVRDVFKEATARKLELGEVQKQSADRYESDFKRFLENPEYPLANMKIGAVTEEIIEEFMDASIKKFKLTQKTFRGLKTVLNGIFKYAKGKKYTSLSISSCYESYDIPKRALRMNEKSKSKDEEIFTNREYAMIYKYLYNNLDIRNIGLLMAFDTGLRIGELSSLKSSDFGCVELEDGKTAYLLTVKRTEKKQKDSNGKTHMVVEDIPKTQKSGEPIIITEDTYKLMLRAKEMNPKGEFLFMNVERGNRIRGSYFNKRLKSICTKLGITPKSTHKIRRFYATMMHFSHLPDVFIADQMRHEDITTTQRDYVKNNAELVEKYAMMEMFDAYRRGIRNTRKTA